MIIKIIDRKPRIKRLWSSRKTGQWRFTQIWRTWNSRFPPALVSRVSSTPFSPMATQRNPTTQIQKKEEEDDTKIDTVRENQSPLKHHQLLILHFQDHAWARLHHYPRRSRSRSRSLGWRRNCRIYLHRVVRKGLSDSIRLASLLVKIVDLAVTNAYTMQQKPLNANKSRIKFKIVLKTATKGVLLSL